MTVFTLNIHHKGVRGSDVPRFIKVVCFGILAKILCLQLEHPEPEASTVSNLYGSIYIIQICSGISHGRVLNGELYTQRF